MNFQRCIQKIAMAAVMVSMVVVAAPAQHNPHTSPTLVTIPVDCGNHGSINAALASLGQMGSKAGAIIIVTGTCHEDVVVQGFDRLTLFTKTGAHILDP